MAVEETGREAVCGIVTPRRKSEQSLSGEIQVTKRTEITVETHRLLVVRRCGGPIRAWCERCLNDVELITPNEAAARAKIGPRAVYRWIEQAELHFREDPNGSLLICAVSLGASVARGQRALAEERKPTHRG